MSNSEIIYAALVSLFVFYNFSEEDCALSQVYPGYILVVA
jgi:hypothetical protein